MQWGFKCGIYLNGMESAGNFCVHLSKSRPFDSDRNHGSIGKSSSFWTTVGPSSPVIVDIRDEQGWLTNHRKCGPDVRAHWRIVEVVYEVRFDVDRRLWGHWHRLVRRGCTVRYRCRLGDHRRSISARRRWYLLWEHPVWSLGPIGRTKVVPWSVTKRISFRC